MQATQHSAETRRAAIEARHYPALEAVNRPTVETAAAAYYLNRRPQTLRAWAMNTGTGPITCIRVNGRLAWSVASIRAALGVTA